MAVNDPPARHLPADTDAPARRRWIDGLQTIGEEPDPRFTLANERTFLAWNRTAVALIGAGFAAGHFIAFPSELARLAVALPPVVLGAVASCIGVRRWHRVQCALRLRRPLPVAASTRFVGVGVLVIAAIIAVSLLESGP